MQTRVWQESSQIPAFRAQRRAEAFFRRLFSFQEHDRAGRSGQKLLLLPGDLAEGADAAGAVQRREHHGKGLFLPSLQQPETPDRFLPIRAAGELIAADPLHRQDPALLQNPNRLRKSGVRAGGLSGRNDVFRGSSFRQSVSRFSCPGQISSGTGLLPEILPPAQDQLRAAFPAGDGLGVLSSAAGRPVFPAALRTHLIIPHGNVFPVIGDGLQDAVARAAGRAADEGIAETAVPSVPHLRKARLADGKIRRDQRKIRSVFRLALHDPEVLRLRAGLREAPPAAEAVGRPPAGRHFPGSTAGRQGVLFCGGQGVLFFRSFHDHPVHPRRGRRTRTEAMEHFLHRLHVSIYFNSHHAPAVAHAPAQGKRPGRFRHKGAETHALHHSEHGDLRPHASGFPAGSAAGFPAGSAAGFPAGSAAGFPTAPAAGFAA